MSEKGTDSGTYLQEAKGLHDEVGHILWSFNGSRDGAVELVEHNAPNQRRGVLKSATSVRHEETQIKQMVIRLRGNHGQRRRCHRTIKRSVEDSAWFGRKLENVKRDAKSLEKKVEFGMQQEVDNVAVRGGLAFRSELVDLVEGMMKNAEMAADQASDDLAQISAESMLPTAECERVVIVKHLSEVLIGCHDDLGWQAMAENVRTARGARLVHRREEQKFHGMWGDHLVILYQAPKAANLIVDVVRIIEDNKSSLRPSQ